MRRTKDDELEAAMVRATKALNALPGTLRLMVLVAQLGGMVVTPCRCGKEDCQSPKLEALLSAAQALGQHWEQHKSFPSEALAVGGAH